MNSGDDRLVCLGEALVDLICEHPVRSPAQAAAFVPHIGGVVANVAVLAAAAGARIALAGGAGDDDWGRWLRERLEAAGVGIDHFRLIAGAGTPLALTTVDGRGEPSFAIYGNLNRGPSATVADALGGVIEDVITGSSGLFISSNTLVGEDERALTMTARARALELKLPVIFDPNLRLHRWKSKSDAIASALACVPGALLVRCNADEARLMTFEEELERAAQSLLKAGARNVVITSGVDGAILRGKFRKEVPAVPVEVVSTVGAGDALMAQLVAKLQITGFYEPAIAAALPAAVEAAARACERWGACD